MIAVQLGRYLKYKPITLSKPPKEPMALEIKIGEIETWVAADGTVITIRNTSLVDPCETTARHTQTSSRARWHTIRQF